MTQVAGHHYPGSSVVFVERPHINRGPISKYAPAYLLHGSQIGGWRMSFNQIVILLTSGILKILIGILLIGRGTTRQNNFATGYTVFGSILVVVGCLMIGTFLWILIDTKKKHEAEKGTGESVPSA